MNINKKLLVLPRPLKGVVLAFITVVAPLAHAETVWTGTNITYNQPSPDADNPANQDRLTANVWLTRRSRDRMLNRFSEEFCNREVSPANTLWASGTLANRASLIFQPFSTWVDGLGGGHVSPKILGVDAVVHIISEDIYFSIKFSYWGAGGVGGYTYQRSTPSVAPPSPTISITNPPSGAIFTAPTNITIAANAAVSSGSVTNVAFFGNNILLGSDQAAPFSITASNLAPGPYALTAVATAAGISTTSSIVNITVLSPSPTVSITNLTSGAIFTAPTNVTIAANAAVSSGSVTNVSFFGNNILLGSDQAAPFSVTVSNLAPGPYALTAVATAAGISTTSSIVNITVLSPSPTVSITNLIDGTVFAAPANVSIAANATVTSGSVTNVAFFGNNILLGSDQTSPFGITASNLASGAYSLTAVATAGGISSTSSAVNISVVSPVAITLSQSKVTNDQFSFNYSANPGLTYVVQNSSNLVNWLPIGTNVASTNPVLFTESFIPDSFRFYRVVLLPNP